MANEAEKMFRIAKPGEIPEYRIRDTKFVPEQPNAHQNIDTLINQNENKDFFELMKGMMPSMDKVENFVPPIGALKLLQLLVRPEQEGVAFSKGLKESMYGEPDPVGPQGLPFSQFMQQRRLDPKVKSIIQTHVDDLTK